MAEQSTPTTEKQPAKKTASRSRKTAPKPPTLDQAADTLLEAFEDEKHPDHTDAVAYFEKLVERAGAQQQSDGEPQPRNVVEAIVAVMREVSHVGKTGRNNQHNYNFRGIDAAVNALGPAMRKHGLIVTPTLHNFEYGEIVVGQNRTKQAHAQVQVAYTFRHSNAEGHMTDLTAVVPGEAMDSGDKGTAKAMSVAFRICLLQQFALPTDEPDADHSSVTRGQAVVVPTAEEVRGACQWAAEQEDLDDAFGYVLNRFGDGLGQMVVPTKGGESLPGDQFVAYAKDHTRAARAEAARAEQDQNAHGDARETRADQGQDARADEQPAAREETPRDAQPSAQQAPAPAQEQPAAQPATQPEAQPEAPAEQPKETPAQKRVRIAWDELGFQAETIGVELPVYSEEAHDERGFHFGKAAKYIQRQRPLVTEALREQGRAAEADAYERIGNSFPIELGMIFKGIDQADRAQAAQPANAQQ